VTLGTNAEPRAVQDAAAAPREACPSSAYRLKRGGRTGSTIPTRENCRTTYDTLFLSERTLRRPHTNVYLFRHACASVFRS
jgi:hypothetical protein